MRIGAAVRNSDLVGELGRRGGLPVLAQALVAGASGQVRNLATVGGNLLQRTRCRTSRTSRSPATSGVRAADVRRVEGEHRNLADPRASDACVATHPSDMAVAMAALDVGRAVRARAATAMIAMPGSTACPGDEPERDTVLAPDELIAAVSCRR